MYKKSLRSVLLLYGILPDEAATQRGIEVDYKYGKLSMGVDDMRKKSVKDVQNIAREHLRFECINYEWPKSIYLKHVKFIFSLILISDRTFRIMRYCPERDVYQDQIVIPLNKFKEPYVYIGVNQGTYGYVVGMTELETFNKINRHIQTDIMWIYKLSLRHLGGPGYRYAEGDTYRGERMDKLLYWDILPYIPRDPIAHYDYCMRLISYEQIGYDIKGNRIKSKWMYGWASDKGFSDFMNPEYFEQMMSFESPIWWEHDAIDEAWKIADYGNVLTGDNTTHFKEEYTHMMGQQI